jgi:tRNA(fMet)-specific endonuclease VapC
MVVIDSSVLIAVARGQLDLNTVLGASGPLPVGMAAITASELLHGVHRATKPRQRALREGFVERLISSVLVFPFDLTVARIHARVWAKLAAKGITVGAHDLMIAATALANGGMIATRDERSFQRIPGLSVLRW